MAQGQGQRRAEKTHASVLILDMLRRKSVARWTVNVMVVKAVKICASLWFFQSRLFETASQTREMRITHAILDKKLALREAMVGRRP